MKELLVKYGQGVVCLDAANKTTDYALTLFFIVVQTQAGYMVAGAFTVQFETASCITEALSVPPAGRTDVQIWSLNTGWWTAAQQKLALLTQSSRKAR
ncbi:unnamed protein product [Ixodes pacificus]